EMRAVSTWKSAAATKWRLTAGSGLYLESLATASRAFTNSGRAASTAPLKSGGVTLPASKSCAFGRKILMASPRGLKASSALVWKALAAFDAVTVVVLDELAEDPP